MPPAMIHISPHTLLTTRLSQVNPAGVVEKMSVHISVPVSARSPKRKGSSSSSSTTPEPTLPNPAQSYMRPIFAGSS